MERRSYCVQWSQALGLECFAFRPVGGLQIGELLLSERFVMRRQRVQTSLLAVIQMSDEALSGEELDPAGVTKARTRVQPGRPVDAMRASPMVRPSGWTGEGVVTVIAHIGLAGHGRQVVASRGRKRVCQAVLDKVLPPSTDPARFKVDSLGSPAARQAKVKPNRGVESH